MLTTGDKIWLSPWHLESTCPSAKLDQWYIGSFTILEQINLGCGYLSHWRFIQYSVLPSLNHTPLSSSLHPTTNNCAKARIPVQQILDSRQVQDKFQCMLDWEGYGSKDQSWELVENIHMPDHLWASIKLTPGSRVWWLLGGDCMGQVVLRIRAFSWAWQ